jgi:hypothetical protein
VDWSNQIKPVIITKYTIPDGSWIHDLWVNEQYVVVQLTANLTNDKQQDIAYQSTYVFTRGSRTYLNAYVAIPHANFHAFVDFNREASQMMSIDTERITIYALATPVVSVMPTNPALAGKPFSFVVRAESRNEYTGENLPCTYSYKFMIVPIDSRAMWPTGYKLPNTYYANYPGELFIPLDRYVLGSNITFSVIEESK